MVPGFSVITTATDRDRFIWTNFHSAFVLSGMTHAPALLPNRYVLLESDLRLCIVAEMRVRHTQILFLSWLNLSHPSYNWWSGQTKPRFFAPCQMPSQPLLVHHRVFSVLGCLIPHRHLTPVWKALLFITSQTPLVLRCYQDGTILRACKNST